MKTTALKWLTLAGKVVGFVAAFNAVPFIDPKYGVVIFAGASLAKDVITRVGDLLDDGVENKSFNAG